MYSMYNVHCRAGLEQDVYCTNNIRNFRLRLRRLLKLMVAQALCSNYSHIYKTNLMLLMCFSSSFDPSVNDILTSSYLTDRRREKPIFMASIRRNVWLLLRLELSYTNIKLFFFSKTSVPTTADQRFYASKQLCILIKPYDIYVRGGANIISLSLFFLIVVFKTYIWTIIPILEGYGSIVVNSTSWSRKHVLILKQKYTLVCCGEENHLVN